MTKSIDERVAELLAGAPPITPAQREQALQLLAEPRPAPAPTRHRRAA